MHAEPERANRTGDQNFAGGGFAGFASDFDAAGIEALDFFAEAEMFELEAVRAKGISFDNLCAGFDVSLMNAENGFRLGGIEFIEAALRANHFV